MKQLLYSFISIALISFLSGCSSKDNSSDAAAESEEDTAKLKAFKAKVQEFYDTRMAIPPEVYEALESGEISQAELDKRKEAGEFPRLFSFKTVVDLPEGLVWENGEGLPEIGSPKAVKGGTLYDYIRDFPRTLRAVGPDSNGSFRRYLLDEVAMSSAIRHPNSTEMGPNGYNYVPGLAEEWAIDKENSTVYVRMDPEARWSDGEPITADDFLFLFYFRLSPHLKAPYAMNFFNRFYSNVTKYDERTFSITVTSAKPDMASYVLGLPPAPEHFYVDFGEDYTERYQWKFAPTTSAYVIKDEDIRKGDSIALTRNKDWWANSKKHWRYRYNFDRIFLKVVRDDSKTFEMFKKGDLDIMPMNTAELWYEKLPNDDPDVENGLIVKTVFYNQIPRGAFSLWINRSKPLLDNINIRLGIQHASNWQLVIDKLFRGDQVRPKTTVDGYGEFTHPKITAREFSVDKAVEYFGKAGFTKRGPDGILVNENGERLSISINTGYTRLKDALTVIKEEAKKAGLEFRIDIMDSTASFKKTLEKQHEIVLMAWSKGVMMYPDYWQGFHSNNAYKLDGSVKTQTNNITMMADNELDDIIERYRASSDVNKMVELAHQSEQIVYDDASVVLGFYSPFYRLGYWRWIKWPDDFNVRISETFSEYGLAWMDFEEKKQILSSKDKSATFPRQVKIYDQYKDR